MSKWTYTPKPFQGTPNPPRPTSNSGFCTGMGSSWSNPVIGSDGNAYTANTFSQSSMTAASSFSPQAPNPQYSSFHSQQSNPFQYNPRDPRQHRFHQDSYSSQTGSSSSSSYGFFSTNSGAPAGYTEAPPVLPYSGPFTQPEPDPFSIPPPQIGFKPTEASMFSGTESASHSGGVRPPSNYPKFSSFVIDARSGRKDEDTLKTLQLSYDYELPEPRSGASFSSSQPGQYSRLTSPPANELSTIPKFSSTASAFDPNSIEGEADAPSQSKQARLDVDRRRRPSQESTSSNSSHGSGGSIGRRPARDARGPQFDSARANTYMPPPPTQDAAPSSDTQCASILDDPEIDTSQLASLCPDAASTSAQLAKLKAFEDKDQGNARAHCAHALFFLKIYFIVYLFCLLIFYSEIIHNYMMRSNEQAEKVMQDLASRIGIAPYIVKSARANGCVFLQYCINFSRKFISLLTIGWRLVVIGDFALDVGVIPWILYKVIKIITR